VHQVQKHQDRRGQQKMAKYVAFLRGVNLGRRNVKKEALIACFADMGLNAARTVLASGNVIFQSSTPPVAAKLEAGLVKRFGFEIGVVVRSLGELGEMISSTPFAEYQDLENMKFYVTLAAGPIADRLDRVTSVKGDFDLVRIDNTEFFSAAYRQENGRFGAGLDVLVKSFKGLLITTRNWNTIGRIIKTAGE